MWSFVDVFSRKAGRRSEEPGRPPDYDSDQHPGERSIVEIQSNECLGYESRGRTKPRTVVVEEVGHCRSSLEYESHENHNPLPPPAGSTICTCRKSRFLHVKKQRMSCFRITLNIRAQYSWSGLSRVERSARRGGLSDKLQVVRGLPASGPGIPP